MQPAETLAKILKAVEFVLVEGGLNSQQLTFIQHIQKTSQNLYEKSRDIPPNEIALKRILPTLGDSFIQQQTVIFGYARMLLEMPASFGGAILSPKQAEIMQAIYQESYALMQFCEAIRKNAFEERQSQRKKSPEALNLQETLANYEPILRYFLQNSPLQLDIYLNPVPQIYANAYHLCATIEHIILTMAKELVEYGQIKISVEQDGTLVKLSIFCTGIALSHDEIAILFEKQGRQLYRQSFEQQGGQIRYSRTAGFGAAVELFLPIF